MPNWTDFFDPVARNTNKPYLISIVIFTLLVLVAKHMKYLSVSKQLAIFGERMSPLQPSGLVRSNSARFTADAANIVIKPEEELHDKSKLFYPPEQPQELSFDEDEHQSLCDLDVDASFATLPKQVKFLADAATDIHEEEPLGKNTSTDSIQELGFLPPKDPTTITKPQPSANSLFIELVRSIGIGEKRAFDDGIGCARNVRPRATGSQKTHDGCTQYAAGYH